MHKHLPLEHDAGVWDEDLAFAKLYRGMVGAASRRHVVGVSMGGIGIVGGRHGWCRECLLR